MATTLSPSVLPPLLLAVLLVCQFEEMRRRVSALLQQKRRDVAQIQTLRQSEHDALVHLADAQAAADKANAALAILQDSYRINHHKYHELSGLYDWQKNIHQDTEKSLKEKTEEARQLRVKLDNSKEDVKTLERERDRALEGNNRRAQKRDRQARMVEDDGDLEPGSERPTLRSAFDACPPPTMGSAPKRPSLSHRPLPPLSGPPPFVPSFSSFQFITNPGGEAGDGSSRPLPSSLPRRS